MTDEVLDLMRVSLQEVHPRAVLGVCLRAMTGCEIRANSDRGSADSLMAVQLPWRGLTEVCMTEDYKPQKRSLPAWVGPVVLSVVVLLALVLFGPHDGSSIFRYKLF
jgi:hypothetical protein